MKPSKTHTDDFWQDLKQHTSARIALGRAGSSLKTEELLKFQLAHAQARDAVHTELEVVRMKNDLQEFKLPILILQTEANDRQTFLLRPDWGKSLTEESSKEVIHSADDYDIALIVADGLSAQAIHLHIMPLFKLLIPKLKNLGFKLSPISLVKYGRVALSDEIGEKLKSKMAIIFIGERPGLSSPDSLGIYLTYHPKKGNTDEKRNCISNVRPDGMQYIVAAEKLTYLVQESMRKQISGVHLKDDLQISLEE